MTDPKDEAKTLTEPHNPIPVFDRLVSMGLLPKTALPWMMHSRDFYCVIDDLLQQLDAKDVQLAERNARIMEAVGIMEWMRDEVDFKDNTEAQRALAPVYAFLARKEQRKKEMGYSANQSASSALYTAQDQSAGDVE